MVDPLHGFQGVAMKRLANAIAAIALIGTHAVAADMPVKAPPLPPPPPPPTWTGFYFGANAGYGWGNNSQPAFIANDPYATVLLAGNLASSPGQPLVSSASRLQGGFGGFQAGYNWQVNRLLVGLEADIQGSSIHENTTASSVVGAGIIANTSTEQQLRWFGTARARLGFLPTSNWLVYGTGGFAYGQIDERVNVGFGGVFNGGVTTGISGFGAACVVPGSPSAASCFVGTSSRTASGWTAGAGTEWLVTRNVTFKAEYLYASLGSGDSFNVVSQTTPGPGAAPSSFRATWGAANLNLVRVGFNYIFN
jgi:outer membrane immunogenic protein